MIDKNALPRKVFSGFFPLTILSLLFLLLCGQFSQGLAAESAETPSDTQFLITSQVLKSKIKEVETITTLEEKAKKSLLELYRKALTNLEQEETNSELADKFVQAIETAPSETRKIRESRRKAEQSPVEAGSDMPKGITLKDIEQQLLKAKTNLAAIEAKNATISRQLAAQNERPAKAGQRLNEIKKNVEELVAALRAQPPTNENPQMKEARSWMQQTRLQALHAETKMLNQELVSMPLLLELTNAQKAEATGELERANSLVQSLETTVNQRRQAEALKTIKEAEAAMQQVADRPKILQQAAAFNTALSDELQSSATALERTTTKRDSLAKELNNLQEKLGNTKQKIALAGLSHALGRALFEQKRNLPNVRLLKKEITKNEARIADTGLHQFQQEEAQKNSRISMHQSQSSPPAHRWMKQKRSTLNSAAFLTAARSFSTGLLFPIKTFLDCSLSLTSSTVRCSTRLSPMTPSFRNTSSGYAARLLSR